MVNINKLKGKIVENGTTITEMAKAIDLDTSTIYRKMQAGGDTFTVKEVNDIVAFLHLTADEATRIFFSSVVA